MAKEEDNLVELDEVYLTPEAVAAWRKLVERLARVVVAAGIKPEELPIEQARLGPEGSLVIFVALPQGKGEVTMTIPKGEWRPREN